jgi:uncharacterized protein (DUF4415 family)
MKRTSTTPKSVSDDSPRLKADDFARARFRIGGQDVSRAEWQSASRERVGKQRITILLDADIVAAYKTQAGDRGYQTLINQALRDALSQEILETKLRQLIRDELRAAR